MHFQNKFIKNIKGHGTWHGSLSIFGELKKKLI